MADLVRSTHEAGGLFVADEVQTGFGRLGDHLWGFEAYGIVPDIVTLGKPMGNGHPVAAVLTRSDIVDRFAERMSFFSTFGGNPVACAAGLAVLDVVEADGIPEHVASVGERFLDELRAVTRDSPWVSEVRGRGLLIGVEFRRDDDPAPDLAAAVMNGMRRRRVLIGTTGPHDNVLKIRPPLVFSDEHIKEVIFALEAALGDLV